MKRRGRSVRRGRRIGEEEERRGDKVRLTREGLSLLLVPILLLLLLSFEKTTKKISKMYNVLMEGREEVSEGEREKGNI